MGHTNQTANYNLPQFVGTDKPSWLGDINDAFAAIDTAIAAAASEASTADGKADALTTTVSGHTTQIGVLQNTVTTQGNTLNTVTSLIGNGTPTTTDQTIIGAINELNAKEGNLSDLTTTDKSSLVAAINEAAAGGIGGNVSVVADGTKTYATLLSELFALVDASKVTGRTVFWVGDSTFENGNYYNITTNTSSVIAFGGSSISGGNDASIVTEFKLGSTSTYRTARTGASSTSFTDNSSTAVTNGIKLAIAY